MRIATSDRVILTFVIATFFVACGDSDDGTDPSKNPRAKISSYLPHDLLGFVSNPDGELIPFATVGGASTGNTGVTTGEAIALASGWYLVEANGYASSYARPSGQVEGITIIAATLTPVGTQAFHASGGDPTAVVVGPVEAPTLSVALGPATFAVDAFVELTRLDPGLLDTAFAGMDAVDRLFISQPFEINARSTVDGSALQPAPGQAVEVTLKDDGELGDPPRLFWFDPDEGQWTEQLDAACARDDAEHVRCQISHFSQHAGGAGAPPPASGAGTDHSRASADTDRAAQDAQDDVAERQRNGEETNYCDVFTPALVAAFMREVDAALAEARSHPSEAAKKMLFDTAGRLQLIGGFAGDGDPPCDVFPADWGPAPDPYAALINATEDVVRKLAAQVLMNPKCPDIDRIEKVLAEAQVLGVEDVMPPLESAYLELLDQCNVWEGRIEYSILMPKAVEPAPLEFTVWYSGARYWTEYHDISFVRHASSGTSDEDVGTFDGTDKVETDFAPVLYRNDVEGTGCSFPVFKSTTWSGAPNQGMFEVSVSGRATGEEGFVPEMVSPLSAIEMAYHYFETGWSLNPGCAKEADEEADYSFPYRGQLYEQHEFLETAEAYPFLGTFGDQLSSLWDILNQGPTSSSIPPAGSDTFSVYPRYFYRGSEILYDVVTLGLSEMRVVMRWNLVHTDYTKGR